MLGVSVAICMDLDWLVAGSCWNNDELEEPKKTNEQYRRFSAATVGGDQKSRLAKMEQAHPFDVPPS